MASKTKAESATLPKEAGPPKADPAAAKAARASIQAGIEVLDHTVVVNVVNVSAAIGAAARLAVAFKNERGDLFPVEHRVRGAAEGVPINLVAASEWPVVWRQTGAGATATPVARNINDSYTIAGVDTFYIGTAGESESEDPIVASAILADPITEATTPLEPLKRYQFQIYAALHRCAAKVRLEILDEAEEVIATHAGDIDRKFRGGQGLDDYHKVLIDFVTDAKATAVRIRIDKGPTQARENSYVFFALPQLLMVGTKGVVRRPRMVPLEQLTALRAMPGIGIGRIEATAPGKMFEEAEVNASLLITSGGRTHEIADLVLTRPKPIEIIGLNLDGAVVRFQGRLEDETVDELTLGVFVDGVLSVETVAHVDARHFHVSVLLAHKHLDGLAHTIEVRHLPSHVSLAMTSDILPFQITSWDALQAYAKAPLDVTRSPAAEHHFLSFKRWFDRLESGSVTALPPLNALEKELIDGFTKREVYPPLTMPTPEKPDVSIVIPTHNKFEVTYFCLCSLLFAQNDTTFEVIIVDDGSSDTTAELEDIISGVKVVRHEAAVGFVGSCNDGADLATGKYIAFLNNDTEVTAGWLDELVATFENFDNVGLVGSKLVYPDGKLQEAGGIVWGSGNPWNVGRNGNAKDPQFNYLRQADYLSGAAILLPRTVWEEVGGFSRELAPAYFEDTDLAMKVKHSGRYVVYVPTSTVYHFEGQSAGTSTASGMKRFQEVNRPKFKKKWRDLYSRHGVEGVSPEKEKDRGVDFRVLFIDQRFPAVDSDAGSYAAFQEIRMFQALGAKVTFLPRNLAWMDRHTLALQRMGVECVHAPFTYDFTDYVRDHAADFDVVFICRYRIAEQIIPVVRSVAPNARIILNLADLHFLRELREAAAGSANYTFDGARATREAELRMVLAADLTLSYNDTEIAILQSHLFGDSKVAKLPWVVETTETSRPAFAKTKDILFLGGFGHPPNADAVKFFIKDVLPEIRAAIPDVVFNVIGSNAPPDILALQSDAVNIMGQVAELDDAFDQTRVYVAPLLAGAGIKGKVLEGMARGSAMVLSPVAAEGTGLVDGLDCLIATTPSEWAQAVIRAYTDESLWASLTTNVKKAATKRFSFEVGVDLMREGLAEINIFAGQGLHYKWARPRGYGRV